MGLTTMNALSSEIGSSTALSEGAGAIRNLWGAAIDSIEIARMRMRAANFSRRTDVWLLLECHESLNTSPNSGNTDTHDP